MKKMHIFALTVAVAALSYATLTPAIAADAPRETQAAPAPAPIGANRFNRLMRTAGTEANAAPSADGIHDPVNPGTEALQPPKEAFNDLPKSNAGNRIDWVKSLQTGLIQPRTDLLDPNKQKQVMDLDIIREVKGSMPDVVYPHKQHTEWLDCAQCHPKIFVPKKGGNAISMAAILMGQYCGACHGKVAFPVSECTKCHSRPKAGSTPVRSEQVAVMTPPAPTPAQAPEPVQVTPIPAAKPAAAPAANMTKDQLMAKGKQVYAENCAACHGEKGEGTPGAFPALKGSKIVKGPAGGHLERVLKGVPDTAMQAWADSLNDEEIAAVVTFERNSWGNNTGDIIQPAAAKAARSGEPAAAAPTKAAAPTAAMSKDQLMAKGKAVYADNCAACHGEKGEGTPGAFPALKGSKIVKGPVNGHLERVLKGVPDTAMQAWADSLNDEEIASVVTFERNSWGNNTGDIVQPSAAKAAR